MGEKTKSLVKSEIVEKVVTIEEGKPVLNRKKLYDHINQNCAAERKLAPDLWNDGCGPIGKLLAIPVGVVEFLQDPRGEYNRKEREYRVAVWNDEETKRFESTLLLIDEGLGKLSEKAQSFMDKLPDGLAKEVLEKYGQFCLTGFVDLGDDRTVALLRGEFHEDSGGTLRHRNGNTEDISSQFGVLVFSSGEVVRVKLQEYSLGPRRSDARGYTDDIANLFRSRRGESKFKEALGTLGSSLSDRKDFSISLWKDDFRNYLAGCTRLDLTDTKGGESLLRYLLASQKRAIMVAYDLGKMKIRQEESQKGREVLLGAQ